MSDQHVHGFRCAETDDHATPAPKWPGWVGLRVGVDHGKHAGHGERDGADDD